MHQPDQQVLSLNSIKKIEKIVCDLSALLTGKYFQAKTTWWHPICCSPDGKLIASKSYDNKISIIDTKTSQQIYEDISIGPSNLLIIISPNNKYLLQSSSVWIKFWDILGKTFVQNYLQHDEKFDNQICFSPDSSVLATGLQDDGSILFWDYISAKILKIYTSFMIHHPIWIFLEIESSLYQGDIIRQYIFEQPTKNIDWYQHLGRKEE